jgi:hypothetical protein
MVQLLLRDNYRGWETINTDPARVQAVTAADIQRVANKYFTDENRNVAIYYTKKKGGAPAANDDPLLKGLTDEEKARVNQIRGMIPQMKAEQVKGFIERIDQQAASAPADKQNAIKAIRKLLEDRLKQLEGGKQ